MLDEPKLAKIDRDASRNERVMLPVFFKYLFLLSYCGMPTVGRWF
jgi:hypothetical protein